MGTAIICNGSAAQIKFSVILQPAVTGMLKSADEFAQFVQNTDHRGRIGLVVRFSVNPGMMEKFLATFQPCIDISVKEKGCIKYDLKDDMSDPNLKWLFEEWESISDLRVHIAARKQSGIPNRAEMGTVLTEGLQFIIAKF